MLMIKSTKRKTIYAAMSPKESLRDSTGQAGGVKQTVYVAMSGGVDSSVAAALLKKRGFNVVGVFMKPWQPSLDSRFKIHDLRDCLWQQDREDALWVASILDIPFLTWDFSKEYGKRVTQYMINAYKKGITPNPDVMCNKEIKFGLFLKRALKEGADLVATGHYVRLKRTTTDKKQLTDNRKVGSRGQSSNINGHMFHLLRAKDENKDQSYFLWTLTQKQLQHCLFPIGDYTKPYVRALAKKFKLPVHDKKDSQGVCFVGELDMHDFLARYITPQRGKIFHINGQMLGYHDGAYFYTVGQRHGLDIGDGKGPYYVIGKDMKKNIIYVGGQDNLLSDKARISNMHWIDGKPKFPAHVDVKIRYRTQSTKAELSSNKRPRAAPLRGKQVTSGEFAGTLKFKRPERAITPGQSAVFYAGNELLGGGIIL